MNFKRYKIDKILNNNAVIIIQHNKETIIMYPGIGFKNKVGNYIFIKPEYDIFRLQNKALIHKFEILLDEIPYDCIKLTQDIITMIKEELLIELNSGLLLSLADHIHFAVTHYKKGYNVGLNSEEMKRFYQQEYNVGLKALDMINQHYQIQLDKIEASSITFHIINAEYKYTSDKTQKMLTSIDQIISIIETHLDRKLDKETLNYSRLVIHLKFFIQRILNHESDKTSLNTILSQYEPNKEIEEVIELIGIYLKEQFHYLLSKEEKFYLFIHITRNIK